MGNKFCKLDNSFIVTADKSFANCVTDKEYEMLRTKTSYVTKPGDVHPGRCMYYDTNSLSSANIPKLDQVQRDKLFLDKLVDSGMKCVKTNGSADGKDSTVTITTTGSIPSNMYSIKSKPSVAQPDIDEFESNYRASYVASVGNPASLSEMSKLIDSYFDTSSITKPVTKAPVMAPSPPSIPQTQVPTTASQAPSTASSPQPSLAVAQVPIAPSQAPVAQQASTTESSTASPTPTTDYADLQQLFGSIIWWLIACVLVVFIFFLLRGLIRGLVGIKKGLNPIQQYAGAKIIKKMIKKVK